MSNLATFSFGDSVVRTSTDASGMVWFCARDVAAAIEHTHVSNMLKTLDDDECISNTSISDTLGRQQQVPFINESGLYFVLCRSSLPRCKPFQNWLAKEVLPSIRKTGAYESRPLSVEERLPGLIKMAEAFGLSGNQAYLAADRAATTLSGGTFRPLALLGVTLVEAKKEVLLTPTQIAKQWGREEFPSARVINNLLAGIDFQKKVGDSWEPTELGKPYAEMLPVGKNHSNGTPVLQLKWKSSVIERLQDAYTID